MRYRAFCDSCRLFKVDLPKKNAKIKFIMPMPKSWSEVKKREMHGQPHEIKPDLSNLLKAIEDAVYQDDSKIWHYSSVKKVWGFDGKIEISYEL